MAVKVAFLRQIKGGLSEVQSIEEKPFNKLSPEKIQKIIIEHRDHGKRLAWSFLTSWRINLRNDEINSIVGAALCEAANRYDEKREASFKTFFFYYLRGMLLKEIARMINDQRVFHYIPNLSIDAVEDYENAKIPLAQVEHNDPEKLILKKQIAEECWSACQVLDELEREVVVRHFIYDEPLIKIAKELKYCRCHISRVKSKGLAKLKRFFKKQKGQKSVVAERLIPEVIRTKKKSKQSYTGGRGRRKLQAVSKASEKIKAIKA